MASPEVAHQQEGALLQDPGLGYMSLAVTFTRRGLLV